MGQIDRKNGPYRILHAPPQHHLIRDSRGRQRRTSAVVIIITSGFFFHLLVQYDSYKNSTTTGVSFVSDRTAIIVIRFPHHEAAWSRSINIVIAIFFPNDAAAAAPEPYYSCILLLMKRTRCSQYRGHGVIPRWFVGRVSFLNASRARGRNNNRLFSGIRSPLHDTYLYIYLYIRERPRGGLRLKHDISTLRASARISLRFPVYCTRSTRRIHRRRLWRCRDYRYTLPVAWPECTMSG